MDALAWCRERMLVPRQPLMASLPFAAPQDRDAILALRTVSSELTQLATGNPDPSLFAARVDWWRQALAGQAEHPALAALDQTHAERSVDRSAFSPLLEAVSEAYTQARFERFEQLWQQCVDLGGPAALLEFRLKSDATHGRDAALELGAAGCLLRQVRDLVWAARLDRWLVPLDLQAQFQVARQDVLEARGGPGWDGLIRTLVARSLVKGERAAGQLGPQHGHLLIHWAVEKRLAAVLVGRPGRLLRHRLSSGHGGNVWAAWRTARQVQKQLKG